MHLSTSSSEVKTEGRIRRRHIAILIALTVGIGVVFELTARFGIARLTNVASRVDTEYNQAINIRKGENTTILFLGNSLLDAAVDMARVRQAFGPERQTKRLMIEQTTYHDWYYGMRRLFDDGARPDIVVLCLTARDLVRSGVRGEYFAYYMMKPSDLPRVAGELDLHPTEALNMLSANLSHFYGLRSEIRKVVMRRLMPFTGPLMGVITRTPQRTLTDDEVRTGAVVRLRQLKETANGFGADFVFIMPPLLANERSGIVAQAGEAVGVPVVALPPQTLKAEHFSDGYHVSPQGGVIYTEGIIPRLRDVLTRVESAGSRHRAGTRQP